MSPGIDSLNVAAATAVACYLTARRPRSAGDTGQSAG
jgi:tRNA G18 (ribose-2'-O)-methylase SpoU